VKFSKYEVVREFMLEGKPANNAQQRPTKPLNKRPALRGNVSSYGLHPISPSFRAGTQGSIKRSNN
jgi:hypothetical protein